MALSRLCTLFLNIGFHFSRTINFQPQFLYASNSSRFEFEGVWDDIDAYYFTDVGYKMRNVLFGKCLNETFLHYNVNFGVGNLEARPTVYASSFEIPTDLLQWWHHVKKPAQMRVDPQLCQLPYNNKKNFFSRKGCEVPRGYLSQWAPRCQIKLLERICNMSAIGNGYNFSLMEANHQDTRIPPTPFLITTKDSIVTRYGDITR